MDASKEFYQEIIRQSDKIIQELKAKDVDEALQILSKNK